MQRRMVGEGNQVGNGEWVKRRDGDGANATNWLNRIAQGFSPGYGRYSGRALSGRPSEDRVCRWFPLVLEPWRSVRRRRNARRARITLRSPLQGDHSCRNDPGLKPWAILSSHFVAFTHRRFAHSPIGRIRAPQATHPHSADGGLA
jgi:hypothetical protein